MLSHTLAVALGFMKGVFSPLSMLADQQWTVLFTNAKV
jgi:hypothetical protein